MKQEEAIGIFDSGIGGTSILNEIIKRLPNEDTIYLSDSKNAPYGEKTKTQIIEYSLKNTQFLLNKHCKAIVVACNTATTNAISTLRKLYPNTSFIGIEPAIKPAALQTKTKRIGVLATQGTLSSELFYKTSGKISRDIKILEQNGNGLVTLIEKGYLNSDKTEKLLAKYLTPMLNQDIDCLVLGCTHYPYLIPQIKRLVGDKIKIIDSGFAVAKQLKNILSKNNLLSKSLTSVHWFYCNSDLEVLQNMTENQKNTKVLFVEF